MATDLNRAKSEQTPDGGDFSLSEGLQNTSNPEGVNAARNLSEAELKTILKEKQSSNKIPDEGGSRIQSSVSEAQMIEATDKQIVDPKIITADNNFTPAALKQHLDRTEFTDKRGNPKLDLKKFLDDLQESKN